MLAAFRYAGLTSAVPASCPETHHLELGMVDVMTLRTCLFMPALLAIAAASGGAQSDEGGGAEHAPAPGFDDLRARIAAYDDALDPANKLSGVMLIMRGDDVLLHDGFGMADYAHGVPNTRETRFCIASITKIFTRLVVWQLLAEERLHLEDELATFVPEFPRGDEITVEHLFRHRAGIPHRVTRECETCAPMTAEKMTARAMEHPLMVEPGSESIYSSAGYSVLARVVEIVEGAPFAEVLRTRIFEPAGMVHTVDTDARTIVPDLARSYMPGRGELLNAPPEDLSYLVGAGSVISTAEDLYRFLVAYRDGGLGEGAWEMEGMGKVAWTGASSGYHAFLNYDPVSETTVIYTGNTFSGGAGQLRGVMPEILAGERKQPPTLPDELVSVDPAVLSRYIGAYASRPGSRMRVSIRGGELLIADSVVLPLSTTRFFFQNWMKVLEFVPAEEGSWALRNGEDLWPRVIDEDP